MLAGLLTGHTNLRYMLHKMRKEKSPPYKKCGAEKETLVHILCECPALQRMWRKPLGKAWMELDRIKEVKAKWHYDPE